MNRNNVAKIGRKLRLGVIGGGPGSFIGQIHRGAALLHEQYELVAGVLSSDPDRSIAAAKAMNIPRPYATQDALFRGESRHKQAIDVLAIMTPNNTHYDLSVKALDCGFHVICEKPLTIALAEARDLAARVVSSGRQYIVAYAYTGYPMVRQARAMVESGMLGELRMIQCEYVQGHLAELTESEIQAKNWHMDPAIAGPSLILGDIATHCHHLTSYITGQLPSQISADVATLVPNRTAHDYCGILSQYANGARGVYWVTQAAAGATHGLRVRVFGSKAGLDWVQEQPNELIYRPLNDAMQILTKGGRKLLPAAEYASHVAIGHPEGYREAFANLYLDLSEMIVAQLTGKQANPYAAWSPDIHDGVRGVAFVETALRSSMNGGRWEKLPDI